jgi:hypothetical protein
MIRKSIVVCFVVLSLTRFAAGQGPIEVVPIQPIAKSSFDNEGNCRERRQGGDPREVAGLFVFDGSQDGNLQVDPQIAVGRKHVFHATNDGLIIYDKKGNFVDGVSQNCFLGGIDPKLFYDAHNGIYGFTLWNPWDQEKLKPANIAVSRTDDPTRGWTIYPVPVPQGADGGGIGYSRKWIGYSYPGGDRRSFVLRTEDAKKGKSTDAYFFAGHLGHPVATQDPIDALHFFQIDGREYHLKRVTDHGDDLPVVETVFTISHDLKHFDWPPKSPQRGTEARVASGDRNPKNIVLQNGCIWFAHAVNIDGRSAVQWHQISLDGDVVQSGAITSPTSSYIQPTVAVNKRGDMLVGFQETSPEMFVSPRLAWRVADDPPGQMREAISMDEGRGAGPGGPWGDYSGSVVDGANQVDLWTIQSVADEEGKGDTVIARLKPSEQK